MCGVGVCLRWWCSGGGALVDEEDASSSAQRGHCQSQGTAEGIGQDRWVRELLVEALQNRGPDAHATQSMSLGNDDVPQSVRVTMAAAVLNMRGKLTSQPYTGEAHTATSAAHRPSAQQRATASPSSRFVLLFNGEIYEGLPGLGADDNDTQALYRALEQAVPAAGEGGETNDSNAAHVSGVLRTLERLRGPWAIVLLDTVKRELWFGRDYFGRRSLVCGSGAEGKLFITSTCTPRLRDHAPTWFEIPATGVFRIRLAALTEASTANEPAHVARGHDDNAEAGDGDDDDADDADDDDGDDDGDNRGGGDTDGEGGRTRLPTVDWFPWSDAGMTLVSTTASPPLTSSPPRTSSPSSSSSSHTAADTPPYPRLCFHPPSLTLLHNRVPGGAGIHMHLAASGASSSLPSSSSISPPPSIHLDETSRSMQLTPCVQAPNVTLPPHPQQPAPQSDQPSATSPASTPSRPSSLASHICACGGEQHVGAFLDRLRHAVDLRSRAFHSADHPQQSIGILFSGGIDCMMIATLLDELLPRETAIDLINVAFENTRRKTAHAHDIFSVPDRVTGISSYEELVRISNAKCPQPRTIRFIKVNVTQSELEQHRPHIHSLVSPLETVLDDSIGCAIWFAARGRGILHSSPRTLPGNDSSVLLLGMGADEQLGGYGRHRSAFDKRGWTGALQEVFQDVRRISSRNLGRDDRVVCDHGKEGRYPFLDESVVSFLNSLPLACKMDFTRGRGDGEKRLLRLAAAEIGISGAASLPKRAIQFGSRIAKMYDSRNEAGAKYTRKGNGGDGKEEEEKKKKGK
ncbi:hypothetical protein PTSG_05508 [Salpingoeca rosetta]|uniref:Glutamine amidotransferase type-2 domain-containing protein n=1 Tax=Salpingoeca rosetta (strain ATCC 50818 / BSB-021) TaxID=946362 RepID=F2UBE8_SALR5|nr:uncharacterized protein PTSG_05508 [Salpingoeca rosetta]EGD73814.1 hypothetical protein PTSG_05508 [Salpingoeca rosetta]|eukprot:XP_004993377.1 hypothetical protein PTSG_05508 [Salpingoeca rosetta]